MAKAGNIIPGARRKKKQARAHPRKRECARARTHPPILRYHQCGKPPEKYETADSDNTNHGAEARSIPPEGLPTRGRKPEINGCLDKYIPTECPPLRKHGAAHAGKICRAVRRSPKIYVMCAGRRPATRNPQLTKAQSCTHQQASTRPRRHLSLLPVDYVHCSLVAPESLSHCCLNLLPNCNCLLGPNPRPPCYCHGLSGNHQCPDPLPSSRPPPLAPACGLWQTHSWNIGHCQIIVLAGWPIVISSSGAHHSLLPSDAAR